MADYDSSLPVRTQTAGDVDVKVSDASTPSQKLAIDSSGRITNVIGDPTTPGNKLGIDSSGRPTVVLADATTPANKLGVDSGGRLTAKISDGTDTLAINADGSINVVFNDGTAGTDVINYNTVSALAAAGTSNHDYTVTASKTLSLRQVICSGSGKAKFEIQTGPVASLTTKAVLFISSSDNNATIEFKVPIQVPSTSTGTVRIIRTNRENQSQDLYTTILGDEN